MSTSVGQVLIVDDQWAVRQQLTRALNLVGIQCDCANDGDDAIDRYLHCRYELIVTDLRMPERNGHSLAVTLLGQPDPPMIVALTGVTDPRLTADLLARGITDIVYKPVNFFDFADRLKHLLESSTARRIDNQPQVSTQPIAEFTEASERNKVAAPPTRHDLEKYFAQSPPRHRWLMLTLQCIDWDRLPNPPEEMRPALRQLSRRPPHVQSNLRSEGRVILNEPALALALKDDFEPFGQPFKLVVRDLSRHGIGLFHTEWLSGQQLAVSWHGLRNARLVVVTRVLRCRQMGVFFEIGATIEHSHHSYTA